MINGNTASKPVCRGRPYWTLARPQSTCSGWDGCSTQQQSSIVDSSFSLAPAGFLHTDVRVHHTVTQDSPSRGAVTGHSTQASTHAHNAVEQRESQTASAHYNVQFSSGVQSSYPNQTTQSSNPLHYTGANLMITVPSSPISSLVRHCNPPKATSNWSSPKWLTGTSPGPHQCSAPNGNPKGRPEFPQGDEVTSPSFLVENTAIDASSSSLEAFIATRYMERSLARSPPAAAGMAAFPSDDLQSLAPASRFHLQASSTRTVAYTTSHTRLPQSGCSHRALNTSKHTRTQRCRAARIPNGKCSLQNHPGDTMIYPLQRHYHLSHYTELALI